MAKYKEEHLSPKSNELKREFSYSESLPELSELELESDELSLLS